MPSDWEWWAGIVEDDSYATSHKTRDEAIAAGQNMVGPGEQFQIIEARSSTAAKYESGNYDIVPFTHTRNHEVFVNGPCLVVEAS